MTYNERAEAFENTKSLADLMTMAIDDMEALMDDDGYEFNYMFFHRPPDTYHSKCSVCAAGAIMANRLAIPRFSEVSVMDFESETANKLTAIDHARAGEIKFAYLFLGYENEGIKNWDAEYGYFRDVAGAKNFIKFWRDEGITLLRGIEADI